MARARLALLLVLIPLIAACQVVRTGPAVAPAAEVRDTHELLDGVLWMETAAEYEMLTRIAYAQARQDLDLGLADTSWTAALEQAGAYSSLPTAVILDVDETVLDNSRFEGRLILDRSDYNESVWQDWVRQRAATVVPGADDFLKYAVSKGVTVFYVTNRNARQEDDTRANLASAGLPVGTDRDVVLTRYENGWSSSDKSARRSHVCESYRVLLLVGDDLGDFVSGAKDTPENRTKLARQYGTYWGSKWILLPNPLYGSWESALYGYGSKLSGKDILQKKLAQVRGF
ncbi:MAG TPA: HAD family acid phosphatase [bacterium]|nr:HAD family acid phosphatase [bacterium]